MNDETQTQNTQIRTKPHLHRRRLICAFIHERTKHGKRTTCRQVAAALDLRPNQINSLLRLCQTEPTQTTYGLVIVEQTGQLTDAGGVTAMTYAAILKPLKSVQ